MHLHPWNAREIHINIPGDVRQRVRKIGVPLWQADLWREIIRAADSDKADEVNHAGIKHKNHVVIARDGSGDGPLAGEVVVFTGALTIPRHTAADLAAQAGAAVATGVTKTTTLLVVGDQDIRRLAGQEKSSKQRKVEKMIMSGLPLRIVTESDFQRLVSRE